MNYLTLCDDLLKESGTSDQGVFSVNGQSGMSLKAVKWIRRAWIEIQGMRDWRFLWQTSSFNTVLGQSEYDPVTNLALSPELKSWVTTSLRLVNGDETTILKHIKWHDWAKLSTTIENPTAFSIRPDNTLVLNTAPTKAYQILFEYYRKPQILTENNDIPLISAEYHEAILYKAMSYLATEQDAPELYQDAQRQLGVWLYSMKSQEIPEITFGSESIA